MRILIVFLLLFWTTNIYSSDCKDERLKQLSKSSTLIITGEIENVEESLNIPSAYVAVVQRVTYKVLKVLKGELSDKTINVAHYVVSNSKTSEEDTNGTRLSAKVFFKGNQLVLFLIGDSGKGYLQKPSEKTYTKYLDLDENCVPQNDTKVVNDIENYLSTSSKVEKELVTLNTDKIQKLTKLSKTKARKHKPIMLEVYYSGAGNWWLAGKHLIARVYSDGFVEYDDISPASEIPEINNRRNTILQSETILGLSTFLTTTEVGKISRNYESFSSTLDHTEDVVIKIKKKNGFKKISIINFKPELPQANKKYPKELIRLMCWADSVRKDAILKFFFRETTCSTESG
jgi:hypothetical protein